MMKARAIQVLDDINNTLGLIDSECTRLCILINECRNGEYWKLRYDSERAWGLATFKSLSSFRHFAAMASAYEKDMGAIAALGRTKAEILIPVARAEGKISEEWKEKCRKHSADRIAGLVRSQYPSRREPKTQIKILENDIRTISERIRYHERQIERLKERLENKILELSKVEAA